jgi:hypothetical protein
METSTFAAAVEDFGDFVFRRLFDKNRRRGVEDLIR